MAENFKYFITNSTEGLNGIGLLINTATIYLTRRVSPEEALRIEKENAICCKTCRLKFSCTQLKAESNSVRAYLIFTNPILPGELDIIANCYPDPGE